MTMTTEELKHEMSEQLASIRKAKKHPVMLQNFEDDLEAYLEALRVDASQSQARIGELYSEVQQWKDISTDLRAALEKSSDACGDLGVRLDHSNRMVEVYSEAYSSQKTRTHNALCEARTLSDQLWETRRELASVQNDREEGHDKLQETTAKLAQQTQTIIALHRVIKAQQNACARLRGLVNIAVHDKNREQAEAHRHVMQAEAIADERWELLEAKQKTIVSQRKRIEQLESDLLFSRNPAKRHGFWLFWMRKSTKAKILPEKTN